MSGSKSHLERKLTKVSVIRKFGSWSLLYSIHCKSHELCMWSWSIYLKCVWLWVIRALFIFLLFISTVSGLVRHSAWKLQEHMGNWWGSLLAFFLFFFFCLFLRPVRLNSELATTCLSIDSLVCNETAHPLGQCFEEEMTESCCFGFDAN